jgi:DNA-binding IclR family transcriptional regulator
MTERGQQETRAPAVDRTLRVLDLLAEAGELRLSEISARLGIAKSTLHHVLAALERAAWLEKDADSMRFSLGIRAWEVGQAYGPARTLSQRAQPFLDRVRDRTGETVRLAVLSEHDNVCVAKSVGRHRLVFDQRVGARLPAHATGLGKVLLAGLGEHDLVELYSDYRFEPFSEHTICDVDRLLADVSVVRARGWAEDNGEYILGIRCVAVPVKLRGAGVVTAMSVSAPSARFGVDERDSVLAELKQAATVLSARLAGEVELR